MQATSSPNGYFFLSPARYRTTKGTGPARFGSGDQEAGSERQPAIV